MATNLDVKDLFEKIGRMYMEILGNNDRIIELENKVIHYSKVTGNVLYAIEKLGYKKLAAFLMAGGTYEAFGPIETEKDTEC